MSLNLQQIIYQNIERYSVFNLSVLNSYFESTFEPHYPKDVIFFINRLFLDLLQVKIICGSDNSMILTETKWNNEVYVWGRNNNGQLGLGDSKNRNTPCKFHFPAEQGIIKEVSFGSAHSIALTDSNEIYSWGANAYGQLGLGIVGSLTTPHKLTFPVDVGNINMIACGGNHTMVLIHKNEVYSCGSDTSGQLGFSDIGNLNTPHKIPGIFFA